MKVPGSKHAGSPTLQETQRESGISSVSSTLQENVVFTQSGSLTWSFLRITGYIPNRPHLGTYSELLVFLNHSLSLSYVSLVYLFECCFSDVNMYFIISTKIPPSTDRGLPVVSPSAAHTLLAAARLMSTQTYSRPAGCQRPTAAADGLTADGLTDD